MDEQTQIITELRERVARLEEKRSRPLKVVLNLLEAAAYIDRSPTTLRALHQHGNGPRRFRNGQKWGYRVADLDAWLSEQDPA